MSEMASFRQGEYFSSHDLERLKAPLPVRESIEYSSNIGELMLLKAHRGVILGP